MTIYAKFGSIDGSVNDKDYNKWTQLNDARFVGIRQSIPMAVGSKGDRVNAWPNFGEFILTKPTDISSTQLFEHAHSSKVMDTVEIHYVATGNPNKPYVKYKLGDVLISYFTESHAGEGERPIETLSLNYKTIEKTYIPLKENNQAGTPETTGYNLPEAKAL